ncbi:MAG: hypothetical protein ACTSRK_15425 [Promethearchaeota archaeon]
MKREPEAFLKEEVKNLYDNHLNWVIRHLETGSKPHAVVDGKDCCPPQDCSSRTGCVG